MNERKVFVRFESVGGDKLKADFTGIGAAGTKAMNDVGKASRAQSYQVQNAALQVGDFFVQVAGGQSVTRALAQQLPQLLGAFGLFGALAGAAFAALSPLIAKMFEGEDAAKALADSTEAMHKSTQAAMDAAAAARVPVEELAKTYSDLADEIERARDRQAELTRGQAERDIGAAIGDVTGGILGDTGNLRSNPALAALGEGLDALIAKADALQEELSQGGGTPAMFADLQEADQAIVVLQDVRAEVEALGDRLGITAEEAVRVATAANSLRDAGSLQEQAETADAFAQELIGALGSVDAVEAALPGVLDALKKIVDEAANLTSNIAFSADEAVRLAQNIGAALDRADRARSYVENAKTIGAYQLYAASRLAAPDEPVEHSAPRARRSGGGSRGGGGSASNREGLNEAKRLYEETRTEAEKYEDKVARINELHREFGEIVTDEVRDKALKGLREEFDGTAAAAKEAAGAIKSAFDGLFDDPKKALEDLGKQLIRMALYRQLAASFPGTFGAGGIIPLAGARAAGGPVLDGRPYLVGEKGPEVFVPSGAGSVVPNHALGTSVEVHNYSGAGARTEKSRGPDGREVVRVIVGEEIARGSFDKPMGGRYQARPQPVRR